MVAETKRLVLREYELSDAEFIRTLVNDPDWIKNIGERHIRSNEDAHRYIEKLQKSYLENGFGFYAVDEKATSMTVGMCGLIKRAELEDVDLGFAFLPSARGKGYAQESSLAVIEFAKHKGIKKLLGIVNPENLISSRVLEKVGMKFERKSRVRPDDIELLIYGMNL